MRMSRAWNEAAELPDDDGAVETRKELRVTMPDLSVWAVPAILIAENRSRFYAERDPDTTYEEEMCYVLNDDPELMDWAESNMDWEDVKDHARQVEAAGSVDYQYGWVNGDKDVVEVEAARKEGGENG